MRRLSLHRGIGPNAALAVLEGTLDVYSPMAFDVETRHCATALKGPMQTDFVLDGDTLRFAALPDFEAPADSDGDNVYDVVLVVSDGSLSDRQTIAISVLNAGGNVISGTRRADTIDFTHKIGPLGATDEEDFIAGKGGKDTIAGGGGSDTLQGRRRGRFSQRGCG